MNQRDRDLEAELEEELRGHLERQGELNRAAGLSAEEARRRAHLQFGSLDAIAEQCREQRAFAWLWQVGRDARFGARLLRQSPGFTLVVVVTLALGIGVTSAMFSLVDAVLLRPLPYPAPEQLVHLRERDQAGTSAVNHINFADWQAQSRAVFSAMGLWRRSAFNVAFVGDDPPVQVPAAQLSSGIFTALGVQPAIGRIFAADDDRPGAARVVVASHGFWQSRLGGDPRAIGRTLPLDGEAYTLIGVMPPGFAFAGEAVLWEPLARHLPEWNSRVRRMGLRGLGRLAPGVTLPSARAALATITSRLAAAHPDSNRDVAADLLLLKDSQVDRMRRPLWMLLAAAGLVWLIACANVANLLLARAVTRQREMALRVALGAGRRRLAGQLVTEALLLALAGAGAGLLVAALTLGLVQRVAQNLLPAGVAVVLDGGVLVFSAGLALLTALAFGLAPLWQRPGGRGQAEVHGALRSVGPSGGRTLSALVVGQIALTMVLLTGAGLFLRSFRHLQAVDAGFTAERVLSFRVTLPDRGYEKRAQRVGFFDNLLARLRTLPGVTAASVSSQIPLDARGTSACLVVAGRPAPSLNDCPSTELHFIEGDYFRTLGIPVRRGRSFTAADAGDQLRVVVIDEALARQLWPGQDPLGKILTFPVAPDPRERPPLMTVVGVVGAVKLDQLDERQTRGQAYFPQRQHPFQSGLTVVMKTSGEGDEASDALRTAAHREVRALDPQLPLTEMRTLVALRAQTLSPQRLNLSLVGGFAALALLLALIGLYGLASYTVERQRAEIGVRLALGAQPGQILSAMLRRGVRLTATGLGAGLVGALATSHALRSLLYDVSPADPLTFAAIALLLAAGAMAACWVPARRAVKAEPMRALRAE